MAVLLIVKLLAFKKNIFETVGKFDESFTYLCDYDFFKSFIYISFFIQRINYLLGEFIKINNKKQIKIKKERIRLFYKYFKIVIQILR